MNINKDATELHSIATGLVSEGTINGQLGDKIHQIADRIQTMHNVTEQDDQRLRDAEIKAFGESTYGCDAADWMADYIVGCREENKRLRHELEMFETGDPNDL